MNWARILGGGIVAGIVVNLADYVMHGMIMAATYKKYPQLFSQTQANPGLFFAMAIAIWITVAILFSRTRQSWGAGWSGGLAFGFYFGLAIWFLDFYAPLVYNGFPYHLVWCWGGIRMIGSLLGGCILGVIVRRD